MAVLIYITQVLSKGSLLTAQKVYQQIVNEDNGGPRHVIQTPRDRNQVKHFLKKKSRKFRISCT